MKTYKVDLSFKIVNACNTKKEAKERAMGFVKGMLKRYPDLLIENKNITVVK